jgi:hypothetical protein
MASEVYEDALELMIGLLEAVPPAPEGADPSYPLPALRPLGRTEARTFQAIVLENPYLRVTVLPDLGGRILSLFDKRTERELLPRPRALVPTPGGRRGVRLPVGIELRLDGDDRPNAMGRVASAPDAPAEDEDPAGVWLAETSLHGGLGFHLHVSLPPDRAEVRVEVRVQNRTLSALPYNGELALHLGDAPAVALAPAPTTLLDGLRFEGATLRAARFASPGWLGPRQVDTWTVHLIPLAGGVTAANPEAAVYLDETVVRVQAVASRPGHKLVLLTADGRSLEAPADLGPERTLEIPLEDLPAAPVALALLDPYGIEVLRADRRDAPVPIHTPMAKPADLEGDGTSADLRRAAFDPARRGPAHVALGMRALAERDFDAADFALEQSLLYNGEDPLAWWALSATRRLRGDEGDRPELLNAHFLAPLDPMLRAESFLGQSPEMGRDPSPLVAPVAEIPEDLVEVACVLLEHGLLDQASRWIDEALRHHDLAMLRYLMADALLRGTRMEAEAAEHLRAAAKAAVPPLPWRPIELRALRNLVARFPKDEAVRRLLALAEKSLPAPRRDQGS